MVVLTKVASPRRVVLAPMLRCRHGDGPGGLVCGWSGPAGRDRRLSLFQPRPGAHHHEPAQVASSRHGGAVGRHGCLRADVHAGVVTDRRGHELVASGADHRPRQHHRPGADDPERPRRDQVRHPFPVYCRPAFGIRGANVPALLRAFVACGWFGIQAWIGGWAIYKILEVYLPSWKTLPVHSYFAINLPQFLCFLFFWVINLVVIYRGIDSIRFLLEIKAPLLIVLGLALLAWAYREAGGFGPMLDQPSQFEAAGPKAGGFWRFFFPALTANVGFWATLSLNIPDFTRYARSQRDQALGQAIALPPAMGLFSFIGVAVTSATIVIFGKAIWDPVELVARFEAPLVHVVALLGLCLATLATNLAANVVSPANDFANLWPRCGRRCAGA